MPAVNGTAAALSAIKAAAIPALIRLFIVE